MKLILFTSLVSRVWAAVAVTPQLVYQFPNTTQPENNIVRLNGQLLTTDFTGPNLYQLDPNQGVNQVPKTVHTFTNYGAVTGIVQVFPEIYAMAVGNSSAGTNNVGSWSVWLVNLQGYQAPDYNTSRIITSKIVDVPQAGLLDGLAILNPEIIVAGDPSQGRLYRINVHTQEVSILISSPMLQGKKVGGTFAKVGINGLKYKSGKLYFTNTGKKYYGYITVDQFTGELRNGGKITKVYGYPYHLDDLNFAPSGNAYLTTGNTPGGGVLRRTAGTANGRNGTQLVVKDCMPNSVSLVQTGSDCMVLLTSSVKQQVLRALVPGTC